MGADGTEARKVLGGQEELFLLVFWSPDGKRLSYQRRRLWAETDIPNPESDTIHASRYESADANTGQIRWSQVPWACRSQRPHLFRTDASSSLKATNPSGEKWGYVNAGKAVWEVKTDAATGAFTEEPRRIAGVDGRTAIESLTATADGQRIMVVKRTDQSAVFVADFERAPSRFANIRRISLDERANYPHAWTMDSRTLIFESDRNGNSDLFPASIWTGNTPNRSWRRHRSGRVRASGWFGMDC